MKRFLLLLLLASMLFFSCGQSQKDKITSETNSLKKDTLLNAQHILNNKVLTKEEQEKLTPDEVIDILKRGNNEFVEDNLTVRNNTARVRDAALGQYPKAVILSCIDSRVPVEDIFHRGIGDIFVARVAGNIVDVDMIGSMEYACKVSGSKVIVVLGHEYCGAIKSAIDDVRLGNITALLSKIKPAVIETEKHYDGLKKSSNPEFVEEVCHTNIQLTIQKIRDDSEILKKMEEDGDIKIVGAVYEMKTGNVTFF